MVLDRWTEYLPIGDGNMAQLQTKRLNHLHPLTRQLGMSPSVKGHSLIWDMVDASIACGGSSIRPCRWGWWNLV